MKNFLMLVFFFMMGAVSMTAQTTKCGMSLEECRKICATNPDCTPSPNCAPAACTKVALQEKESTSPKAVLTTIPPKATCQKAQKACCAKMAKQSDSPKTETITTQVALKQD